jgi:hypothetical protein
LYEFQDFRWKLLANQHIINDTSPTGIARAQERWWAQEQQEILHELQGWLEQGWEPVTPPGPDCYEISVHRAPLFRSWRGWALFIAFSIVCLGIPLLLQWLFGFYHETYYASAFRVQLKRAVAPVSD